MKKVIKILSFFVISLCILTFMVNVYGFSVEDVTGDKLDSTQTINKVGNTAITALSTIGSVVSVIVLVVLGIKYMMGSVEEKAEYKKTMMPYLIGAAFVFAASAIASIVYNLAIQL